MSVYTDGIDIFFIGRIESQTFLGGRIVHKIFLFQTKTASYFLITEISTRAIRCSQIIVITGITVFQDIFTSGFIQYRTCAIASSGIKILAFLHIIKIIFLCRINKYTVAVVGRIFLFTFFQSFLSSQRIDLCFRADQECIHGTCRYIHIDAMTVNIQFQRTFLSCFITDHGHIKTVRTLCNKQQFLGYGFIQDLCSLTDKMAVVLVSIIFGRIISRTGSIGTGQLFIDMDKSILPPVHEGAASVSA